MNEEEKPKKRKVLARKGWETDPEMLKQVKKLAGFGLTAAQIADFICVSRSSFFEKKVDGTALDTAFKEGKADAAAFVTGNLFSQIKGGNITAIIFYCKTQLGWKETSRTEHTGSEGAPIQVEDTTKVNVRDHLKRVLSEVLETEESEE